MRFSKTLVSLLSAALLGGVALEAQAHRAWIVPSATVLSGEEPWVTFDAAISNTLFHADHAPMRLEGISVVQPDGQPGPIENGHTGKYRSTFDLVLKRPGTYRIATASGGLMARWEDEKGQRQMWPGRGQPANDKDFARAVPAKARNLEVSRSWRRMETFVTAGAPSTGALKPTGEGLELDFITHPNDLFAGETAEFRLLFNGAPAAGAKVSVIPGAMRYRNQQDDIELTADKDGRIQITWPAAGMYWLNASYQSDKATPPATRSMGSYTATFEVLPE